MQEIFPYVTLVALWSAYFFLHSYLATSQVKQLFSFMGKYYRLSYSFLSVLGLIGIIAFMMFIPAQWLWKTQDTNRYFGMMLATFGVFVIRLGFKQYKTSEFIGTAQLNKRETKNIFQRSGILNHISHPIYSGTMLLAWGLFIFAPHVSHLVSTICIQIYLHIGTWLEEKKLVKEFGDSYRKYQQEVPRFIPRFKKKSH